jgi:protein farnesyltransferase/geranylgeranyltransferase type-1 subunit alpha
MSLRGIIFEGKSLSRIEWKSSLINSLLKHLKKPYTSILPAITIYTDKPISTDSASTLPMPSDPLPKDTPLPISYALELYAESLLEQNKNEEAAEVFAQLGGEVDRIRASYWDYRRQECLQ